MDAPLNPSSATRSVGNHLWFCPDMDFLQKSKAAYACFSGCCFLKWVKCGYAVIICHKNIYDDRR